MALALFACGEKTPAAPPADNNPPPAGENTPAPADPGTPTPAPIAPSAPPTEDELGSDPLDKVGFYDESYDYNANPKYKVIYVCIGFNDLNSDFNNAFANWAKLANVQYDGYFSAASNEELLAQLPTLTEQGYDGILLDPDMMQFEQIKEVCDRVGLAWQGCMGQALKFGEAGPEGLIHPYVGFSHTEFGRQLGVKLIDYAKTNWADATNDNTGFIGVDMSTSPPLHERVLGGQIAWADAGYPAGNYFISDVGGDMTVQAAQNVVESTIALNPQIEYWLIIGVIEDFADGAANAIDNVFGNADNACIATIGGKKLATKWDEGITSAWRFVLDSPTPVYAEPLFFALYAYMSGQATPETIWPSWIDHNPALVPFFGEEYAQLQIPAYFQEQATYKQLLTWANLYTRSNIYPYNEPGITIDSYSARAAIPDSFKG
jgi:ABC-type sugar transport system substrate-binding protein